PAARVRVPGSGARLAGPAPGRVAGALPRRIQGRLAGRAAVTCPERHVSRAQRPGLPGVISRERSRDGPDDVEEDQRVVASAGRALAATTSRYQWALSFQVRSMVSRFTRMMPKRLPYPWAHSKLSISDHRK